MWHLVQYERYAWHLVHLMAFGLMVVQNAMAFGTIDVAFGTMSNI
jgi:hypothetical protein